MFDVSLHFNLARSNFVVPAYCGQVWRISSSYCLKIHSKNIYGTVDRSSTRIFHFWLMMRMLMMKMMKAARLYIYFPYGKISNNTSVKGLMWSL